MREFEATVALTGSVGALSYGAQVEHIDEGQTAAATDALFYKVDTFLPNGLSQRIVVIDTPSLTGVYSAQFGFQTYQMNHSLQFFSLI